MIFTGIVTWIAAALAAFALSRVVARGRRRWFVELAVALSAALLAGLAATAMNFGGWQVFEPAAVAFCALSSITAVGLLRLSR